jgi:hypothetical protein
MVVDCLPRKPRGEPCESESPLARSASLALRNGNSVDPACNVEMVQPSKPEMVGPGLARPLGVSQMHIWKLTRQFKDGRLNVRSPLRGSATFEELGNTLGTAQWQTRKMKEQGLLCYTCREAVARFARGRG